MSYRFALLNGIATLGRIAALGQLWSAEPAEGGALVAVQDAGPDEARLFDGFYTTKPGDDLGLSI